MNTGVSAISMAKTYLSPSRGKLSYIPFKILFKTP